MISGIKHYGTSNSIMKKTCDPQHLLDCISVNPQNDILHYFTHQWDFINGMMGCAVITLKGKKSSPILFP